MHGHALGMHSSDPVPILYTCPPNYLNDPSSTDPILPKQPTVVALVVAAGSPTSGTLTCSSETELGGPDTVMLNARSADVIYTAPGTPKKSDWRCRPRLGKDAWRSGLTHIHRARRPLSARAGARGLQCGVLVRMQDSTACASHCAAACQAMCGTSRPCWCLVGR